MNNQDIVSVKPKSFYKTKKRKDIVSVDRISELPEALILEILSLLPTKVAIATSVLSKQWKSYWKMVPDLDFDSNYYSCEVGTFSKNVCKAMLSHKAPVLQSLYLKVCLDRRNAMDTGVLLGIAFARYLRKLVLQVSGDQFIFPKSLYNSETLETLQLGLLVLMDVPSSVCLKSLKTLHLSNCVGFKDDKSVINFLSGCPNLENLDLDLPSLCSVKIFTIAVPSLQRLSIFTYNNDTGFVVNAPSLKYLTIGGPKTLESCFIENVPELVGADLIDTTKTINEKLLRSLTSAKRLSLALLPFQNNFPVRSIFYQLVSLELYTNYAAWGKLLTLMLDASPKLQVLKLIRDPNLKGDFLGRGKWSQPKNVPECLLLHLKTFMWEGYQWIRKYEIQVAKYILSNTHCLKRATFASKFIIPEERIKMVDDLNSVVRASISCQLLVHAKKI